MKTVLSAVNLRRMKKVGAQQINIHPYGTELIIFPRLTTLDEDYRFIFNYQVPLTEEFLSDSIYGLSFWGENEVGGFYCVAFEADKYREETIWHEALHATVDILNAHGVMFTFDNHEPFAYTQGYIVSQIRKKIFKLPEFAHAD